MESWSGEEGESIQIEGEERLVEFSDFRPLSVSLIKNSQNLSAKGNGWFK